MRAARNQSGKMRHIDQVKRANFVRNLPHAGEINDPRIGAAAADDELRAFFFCNLLQFVVVDGFSFFGHAVRNNFVGWPCVR